MNRQLERNLKAMFHTQEDMENAFKHFSEIADTIDTYDNGSAAFIGKPRENSDIMVTMERHFYIILKWKIEVDTEQNYAIVKNTAETKGLNEESIIKIITDNNGSITNS